MRFFPVSAIESRKRFIISASVAILVVSALLFLVWRPWYDRIVEVEVILSADGEKPTSLARKSFRLSSDASYPLLDADDMQLEKWSGKLVKFAIKANVKSRDENEVLLDVVGCKAELVSPNGSRKIDFAGWHNDGRRLFTKKSVGSPAYALDSDKSREYPFGIHSPLWTVLRVPAESALRLSLQPYRADEWVRRSSLIEPSAALQTEFLLPRIAEPPAEKCDVFIYLIDALRADHLGCYGYPRPTSPNIDAFSKEAVLFEDAHGAITWTLPSVSTIVTGLYPYSHGVIGPNDKLGDWSRLLPETMKIAGYNTCAVATNAYVGSVYGFARGIDKFVCQNQMSPAWVNAQAEEFLAKQAPAQPVYVYLHTLEPHTPYRPEPETLALFDRGFEGSCDGGSYAVRDLGPVYPKVTETDIEHLIDRYDAEIRDNDTGFGQFLDLLKKTGRYEDSLIILVADHGEAFAEHQTMEHGRCLNQEEMHIPLVVRFPGGKFAGTRVRERASLIDIYPTIMAQTGLEPPTDYSLPGLNLARLADSPKDSASRIIYAELPQQLAEKHIDLIAVIDEQGYKSVLQLAKPDDSISPKESIGLWNAEEDLKETTDLTAALPVRASYHEELAGRWMLNRPLSRELRGSAPKETIEMTEEMKKDLRALGYLD